MAGRLGICAAALIAGMAFAVPAGAQDRGAIRFKPADSDQPLQLYSRSFALVIGIDDYENGWPRLNEAVKDAEAVSAAFTDLGFEVRLETSAQLEADPANPEVQRKKRLTGARIYQIMREFLYQAGQDPQSRIFIWFAGHGESIKSAWGLRSSGYLVGADAPNPKQADAQRRTEAESLMKERSMSLAQLGALMDEIPAKHIMAVFDSCFAGTIFSGLRSGGPPPTIRRSVANPSRLFFTSGSEGETVKDDGRFRSLFVDAVLGRRVADRNKDGYLTGTELGLYLKQEMADSLKSDHTPQFGPMHGMASSEGDFVFSISTEALAALNTVPQRPEGEVLHERFWGFVREEKSPPLIDRFVTAFPDTPFKETAIAHAQRLREPIVVAGSGLESTNGPGAGEERPPPPWWKKPGDATPLSADWLEVPVLFGTDRALNDSKKEFTKDRARQLSVGGVVVTVPTVHQTGEIERPSPFSLLGLTRSLGEQPADRSKYFTVKSTEVMDAPRFRDAVASTAAPAKSYGKQGLLYIHGYNSRFEDAVFRAAQLAVDIGFDGPVMAYSWPSGGTVTGYTYDRESALASERYLREFLQKVGEKTGVEELHVIAHSMGAQPLLGALLALARQALPTKLKIGQVILAAPDVDRDYLLNQCTQSADAHAGMTIYASSNDYALIAARRLWGGIPRAGEISNDGEPFISTCARTIDISATSGEMGSLSSRELLADTRSILQRGREAPDQRNPALQAVNTQDGVYWKLPAVE